MLAASAGPTSGGRRRARVLGLVLTVVLGACSASTGDPADPPAGATTGTTASPSAERSPPEPPSPEASSPPTEHPPAPQPAPSTEPPREPTPRPTPEPAPPEPALPAAWRGVDLERIATQRRVVALTFDGGSSDAAVSSILGTLDRYDAPATFFVTGAFARSYPDSVRAMARAGHPVGNHSDTHLAYPDLTNAQIHADLAAAESAITALTGRPARPLFRFPYGARTDADIAVVNDAGYLPVRWTVDSLGWKGTSGGLDAGAVAGRVLSGAVAGQIVLLHVGANPDDGTTLDADALPAIIEGLRAQGYELIDLADLVNG
ncbi:polysaccharide deacetylase family protein [Georgenia sp. H159]|uniref:polysaccharide deacetylase family protein n=1 Tax=Georgenia sp. H159 TaxID=3076115 RepID=UPI002D7908C0|nr:polysaccharide deacetylase family protein [Georgenia sp. H159]